MNGFGGNDKGCRLHALTGEEEAGEWAAAATTKVAGPAPGVTPSFRQHCAPPIFLEAESRLLRLPAVDSLPAASRPANLLGDGAPSGGHPDDILFMMSHPLGCLLWRIPFRRRRAPLIFLEADFLLATSPGGTLVLSSCPA